VNKHPLQHFSEFTRMWTGERGRQRPWIVPVARLVILRIAETVGWVAV
jgi:hypothetical protein